jgi:hypothetical protein
MICTLTARRLRPGAADDFRAAFEEAGRSAPEEIMRRWTRVFVCRDVTDENVFLTFGLFDGTVEELRQIQAQAGDENPAGHVAAFVDAVLLDGSYEVLEEFTP